MSKRRKHKQQQKKYNPLKMVKKLARDYFLNSKMGEKVFKDKNRLRVEYAKRQSFVLDFIILFKTTFSVINSTLF